MKPWHVLLWCVLVATASWLSGQAKIDAGRQIMNYPPPQIIANPGAVVACVQAPAGSSGVPICTASPDAAYVLYRVPPPAGPGACPTADFGSGAYAVDEHGYLYFPSAAWWNMTTNQPMPTGQTQCVWLRLGPGATMWTPDRPAGQPTTN